MLPDMTVRNDVLDWCYGTTPPARAAYHDVALYDADGFELTDVTAPGYERSRVVPADWGAAVNGQKSVLVEFAPPTDEWDPVVGWALIDDAGRTWDDGDLVDPLLVTSASDEGPTVVVTVAYETDVDELLPSEPDPESDPEDVDPEIYVEPDDGDPDGSAWADPDYDTAPDDGGDDDDFPADPGTPLIP